MYGVCLNRLGNNCLDALVQEVCINKFFSNLSELSFDLLNKFIELTLPYLITLRL